MQSFALITLLKFFLLFGMTLMHTRVRFKLQFFEFEEGEQEPPTTYSSSPGYDHGYESSPDRGSTPPPAIAYSAAAYERTDDRRSLDP